MSVWPVVETCYQLLSWIRWTLRESVINWAVVDGSLLVYHSDRQVLSTAQMILVTFNASSYVNIRSDITLLVLSTKLVYAEPG